MRTSQAATTKMKTELIEHNGHVLKVTQWVESGVAHVEITSVTPQIVDGRLRLPSPQVQKQILGKKQ